MNVSGLFYRAIDHYRESLKEDAGDEDSLVSLAKTHLKRYESHTHKHTINTLSTRHSIVKICGTTFSQTRLGSRDGRR